MRKIVTDLRSSFWFLPAIVVLIAASLAIFAVEVDSALGAEALSRFPRLFGARAEGSRQLLAAIACSTITVAGVVFSITIVALSLTSAQYSPRVLRNFMRDRWNQAVLGIFVGVYVYCILVLRTVRGGEDAFVPAVSIVVAIAMALVSIGFLIFFIHHIATSIQVSEITARIARETISAIREHYPTRQGEQPSPGRSSSAPDGQWVAVNALQSGYIQSVDDGALLDYARRIGRVLRMERAVGEFVIAREPLVWVAGPAEPDQPVAALIRSACSINTYRDVSHDPDFGMQQLVDIALKALSPGINDTATARNSLNYLISILSELVGRGAESAERYWYDEAGKPLLVRKVHSFQHFLNSIFDAIRRSSAGNPDMMLHALHSLERLGRTVDTSLMRRAMARHVSAIEMASTREDLVEPDRVTLAQAASEVRRMLETACSGRV